MEKDNETGSMTNLEKLGNAFGDSFIFPHVLPLGYQCPTPADDKLAYLRASVQECVHDKKCVPVP